MWNVHGILNDGEVRVLLIWNVYDIRKNKTSWSTNMECLRHSKCHFYFFFVLFVSFACPDSFFGTVKDLILCSNPKKRSCSVCSVYSVVKSLFYISLSFVKICEICGRHPVVKSLFIFRSHLWKFVTFAVDILS